MPDDLTNRVLEHLRKLSATRPKTQKRLVSHVVTHLGRKITEAEASNLVASLQQAGHVAIGEKGAVTYCLEQH